MATETATQTESTGSTSTPSTLQALVKSRLGEAQKGLQSLEAGTQKALQTLQERGQRAQQALLARAEGSRKEVEAFLARLENGYFSGKSLKELGERVEQLRTQAGERLEALRTHLVEGSGLATQAQVQALHGELAQLSQKLEAALNGAAASAKKGAGKVNGEARAS